MIVAIIIFGIFAILFLFLFIKQKKYSKEVAKSLNEIKLKYKDIIDIETTLNVRKDEEIKLNLDIENLKLNFDKQREQLNQDYIDKRKIYENLLNEISLVEENLDIISYGLYKPHYDFKTSEEYKQKLEEIISKEKELIKNGSATYCPTKWTVSGSVSEGTKMVKHQSKLMLRAFNGECDSAISKVSWSNIGNIEARLKKAFEAINKLGSTQIIEITREYCGLKFQELKLEFELQEKLHQEKEEQRRIREQMREEQKVQQEIEKAKLEATKDEENYQKALEKAKSEIAKTTGAELDSLHEKIRILEENLKKAQEQKERAISLAQQTKRGHVYVISNIGSFGDNVYKIGMTRRIEPLDRVYELGGASVPFDFDVHGLIFSENAPELERTLHKQFENKKLNLVDTRSEFFELTIDEIENKVKEMNLNVELTKIAEAKEYRTSLSIKEAKLNQKNIMIENTIQKELEKFPESLN